MVVPPHPMTAAPREHSMNAESKALMRAQLRVTRRSVEGPPVAMPPALAKRLSMGSGTLATYLPIDGEIDPEPVATAALACCWRLALPHVTARQAVMRFLRWSPGAPLERGPFGLSQPAVDAPDCTPDVVLTPLIAFDAALNRLGQGAGHYDRAFAALPHALRIGVAWAAQQRPQVPVDPWDIPLHGVITEQGWIGPETL